MGCKSRRGRRRRARAAGLGATATWLALACGGVPEPQGLAPCGLSWREEARARDLVLVVNDTMRRDRASVYGGPAPTPELEAFAEQGLRFTRAMSQAPWTKPSMATLFTGLYPSQHGVLSHPELPDRIRQGLDVRRTDVLPPEARTLAELFREAGHRTAAFVSNPWMTRGFGFEQGFEVYDDARAANDAVGTEVVADALRWLRAREDQAPVFLYVHTMDSHAPWPAIPEAALERARGRIEADERPLPPAARSAIARAARLPDGRSPLDRGVPPNRALLELTYDQGVVAFDRAVGALLRGLAERPGPEPAVVVTSDHGEALLERGRVGHGASLYGTELDVPLLARLPGLEPDRDVTCPVGLIDLLPTLCRYFGLDCPAALAGRSFLASPEAGSASPRFLAAEGVMAKPGNRAVRGLRAKLLWRPDGAPAAPGRTSEAPVVLFDLLEDPNELHDLLEGGAAEPPPAWAEALRRAVPEDGKLPRRRAPVDEATRRRLEALGYGGGSP